MPGITDTVMNKISSQQIYSLDKVGVMLENQVSGQKILVQCTKCHDRDRT